MPRTLLSISALAVSVVGWLPLVISAGRAMDDRETSAVATPLALAGAAALIAVSLGAVALRSQTRVLLQIVCGCAIVVGGTLGVVALVFAVSFHW